MAWCCHDRWLYCQSEAIIKTNADLLATGPWEKISMKILIKFKTFFIYENASENGGHFVCAWMS